MFADMDITGYTQLKFKAKGSVGTYLGSGSGYVGLSTDWREVIVTNNNDGTWKVTLTGYGDNFTISATNLKDVFVWTMWQSAAGTLYTTELRGEKIPLYGENLGCALKDGADVDESAPDG